MTATSSRDLYEPMVHLRTVSGAFHARVIAARLGADGILTELRGSVGGPYPFGAVSIWVSPGDQTIASELLMADEVESAFDDTPAITPHRRLLFGWQARRVFAALFLVMLVFGTLAGRLLT
jgi:hypothetical protein